MMQGSSSRAEVAVGREGLSVPVTGVPVHGHARVLSESTAGAAPCIRDLLRLPGEAVNPQWLQHFL